MKKRCLLLALALALALLTAGAAGAMAGEARIALTAANFPDRVFRKTLSERYDKNGDGAITGREVGEKLHLDVSGKKLTSLEGIKRFAAFPNLEEIVIDCSNNALKKLDVSGLAQLKSLTCHDNKLTSLKIGGCPKLDFLWCSDNRLKKLNLSGATGLRVLICYNNRLKALDLSHFAEDAKRLFARDNMTVYPKITWIGNQGDYVSFDSGVRVTMDGAVLAGQVSAKKVALNRTGTVALKMGKTLKLKASVTPADADTTLTWSSDKPKVATVDQNGRVRPVAPGKATVTVTTDNGKKASVKVKVKAK